MRVLRELRVERCLGSVENLLRDEIRQELGVEGGLTVEGEFEAKDGLGAKRGLRTKIGLREG